MRKAAETVLTGAILLLLPVVNAASTIPVKPAQPTVTPPPAATGATLSSQPAFSLHVTPHEVDAGGFLTVRVHAPPHTPLKIEARDLSFTQMFNLLDQQADEQGNALWRFQISHGYRADILPIIVTAELNDRSFKLTTYVRILHGKGAANNLPLSFVSIPPVARAGERVSLSVKTTPGAKVHIEAQGAGFPQASSLLDRTAGKDGMVTWTWQIRDNYESNVMPIVVSSDLAGEEKKISGEIRILPGNIEPTHRQALPQQH